MLKRFLLLRFLLFFLFCSSALFAQAAEQTGTAGVDQTAAAAADGTLPQESTLGRDVARWTILGGTIPFTFLIGVKSWDWGSSHEPMSQREYWFGADTTFGGADKAGHFLAHYVVQRSTYSVFDWTEYGSTRKWWYSLGTTMSVGLFIECGDAFTSRYGFSWEDIVADYSGMLIGAALDYSPILDGFFGFSFGYLPSPAFRAEWRDSPNIPNTLSFVNDYSGWQYMFNFKPAGFERLGIHVPFVLRILSIDAGWYTKGYSTYANGKYDETPSRNFFVGLSINSAQLISEIWAEDHRGPGYTVTHKFLEYYHLPYDRLPVPTRYVNDLDK